MDKHQVNRHEKKLAKRLGGKTTPNSGATDGYKGDIRVGCFMVDDKSTQGGSISVKKAMLSKLAREAREAGKEPCLSLSFKDMGLAGDTWFLIPEWVFKELV